MNLKEYKEKLNKHDWFYVMTEDPKVYDSGLAEENEIKKLAESKKSFMKAYETKKLEVYGNKTTNYVNKKEQGKLLTPQKPMGRRSLSKRKTTRHAN